VADCRGLDRIAAIYRGHDQTQPERRVGLQPRGTPSSRGIE